MKRLLSILAVLIVGLAACGTDAESVSYKGEVTSEDGSTITTVEYTKEGDDITEVSINAEKDGIDKRTDEYGMVGDNGLTWGEQVDAIQEYIVNNDEAPTTNSEGSIADAVSSATISVGDIIDAFDNAEEVQGSVLDFLE